MHIHYVIHNRYNDVLEQKPFLEHLCMEFDSGGEVVFQNKRNVIRKVVAPNGETLAVKRFNTRAGIKLLGLFGKISKARQAYENALLLERNGIATPTPIAYVEIKEGKVLQASFYLSLFTPDTSISPLLERDTPEPKAVDAFAALLARMHEHAIIHHDTNLSNVLYHEEGGQYMLSLIDINRLRQQSPTIRNISDDLMRFTGRLNLFIAVLYRYAQLRHIDNIEAFVRMMTQRKIAHDAQWTRRKRFLRFFK